MPPKIPKLNATRNTGAREYKKLLEAYRDKCLAGFLSHPENTFVYVDLVKRIYALNEALAKIGDDAAAPTPAVETDILELIASAHASFPEILAESSKSDILERVSRIKQTPVNSRFHRQKEAEISSDGDLERMEERYLVTCTK